MSEDKQLKEALAKMLPEKIRISAGGTFILWSQYDYGKMEMDMKVKDTEWLFICQMVWGSLTEQEKVDAYDNLFHIMPENENHGPVEEGGPDLMLPSVDSMVLPDWRFCARALCRVKGIDPK